MTTINRRGFYPNFAHDRKEDWDFLRAWEPSIVRLMLHGSHSDPNSVDVYRVRRVYETAPNATILLRVWDVDDRNLEAHHRKGARVLPAQAGMGNCATLLTSPTRSNLVQLLLETAGS